MNENNNRLNATLPAAALAAVNIALSDLETALNDYITGLTEAEREALPKINVANRAFVQDALTQMGTPTAATFLPPYLQTAVADAGTDLALYEQMDSLYGRIQPILQKIIDTRILAGSEAYTTGLAFYKMAQSAAKSGVPGAQGIVDALKARFSGQGPSSGSSSTPGGGTD